MRKIVIRAIPAALLIGLVWFIWFRPVVPEAPEAEPASEVPVKVGKITRTTLRGYITGYGVVAPEPGGERPAASARVAPAVPGVIVGVNASEGQHVAKNEVLFQLDSRAADVAVAFAEKTLDRQKKLVQVEGTSQKALQEAEQQLDAARVQQELLRVASPLAGVVTRVNVKPGEAVDLTTVLGEVMDLNRLVIGASIPSAELASLKLGQTTEVRVDKSGPLISGSLIYIGADVDVSTGTVPVRASLPADSGLLPGQFVMIRIVCAELKDRLAVPVESVVQDEEGVTVIAVIQNDTAKLKPVKAGLRDDGLVEIEADGLQPGMTVVTEGAYALPRETKVRVLNH